MSRQQDLINHWKSKKGMRGKINAMCISCIYDQDCGSGTWRQQVEACTSPQCPLFDVRPVSHVGADEDEDLAGVETEAA